MRIRRQRGQPGRRGAALVETAFTLPVFFLVVLGIVEFGRAMMVSQIVTNGAREGARLAILDGSSNTEVEQAVRDFLQQALAVDPGSVTVTITVTPAPNNPSPGNEVANAQMRDLCAVRVEVPFDDVSFIKSKYLTDKNLVGYCAMRHE